MSNNDNDNYIKNNSKSDDNNDNHNTGQAFKTYISTELTYQFFSSTLIVQVLATLIVKVPVRHLELKLDSHRAINPDSITKLGDKSKVIAKMTITLSWCEC